MQGVSGSEFLVHYPAPDKASGRDDEVIFHALLLAFLPEERRPFHSFKGVGRKGSTQFEHNLKTARARLPNEQYSKLDQLTLVEDVVFSDNTKKPVSDLIYRGRSFQLAAATIALMAAIEYHGPDMAIYATGAVDDIGRTEKAGDIVAKTKAVIRRAMDDNEKNGRNAIFYYPAENTKEVESAIGVMLYHGANKDKIERVIDFCPIANVNELMKDVNLRKTELENQSEDHFLRFITDYLPQIRTGVFLRVLATLVIAIAAAALAIELPEKIAKNKCNSAIGPIVNEIPSSQNLAAQLKERYMADQLPKATAVCENYHRNFDTPDLSYFPLGIVRFLNGEREEAIIYMWSAHRIGDTRAASALGAMLFIRDEAGDRDQAIDIWARAAARGDAASRARLDEVRGEAR